MDELDVGGSQGVVGLGEVVSHARAADFEAELVSAALELADVLVGRRLRVAGEVVAGGVDGVEVVLGAEVEQLEQRKARTGAGVVERVEQELVKGKGVEADFEARPAGAMDGFGGAGALCTVRRQGETGAGREGEGREGRAVEEVAAGGGLFHGD